MLEKYGHGGDLDTASEYYGAPSGEWLDFSSNMNPLGPPEAVETVFRDHWREIVRYPDPAARLLRRKLSVKYDIPEACFVIGNGAAELIDAAVRTLAPQLRRTLLPVPSFSEYGQALRKAGVAIKETRLTRSNNFAADAEAWAREAADCDSLFVGHPNNPTGRLLSAEAQAFIASSGKMALIDEAFLDFAADEANLSFMRAAAEDERFVVFRSMTKFYAIPGIRLGFLVAHPRLAERVRESLPPWSVNFLAQRIGEAVMDDTLFAARTREWLDEERPWLTERLGAAGFDVVAGDVNFILASLPAGSGFDARELQRRLAEMGILIRDASTFSGLDSSFFRVAVKLRPDNERLVAALVRALEGGGKS